MRNNEINKIAEYIINKLKGKVIIHRYDSFSTNSVYLKFDYGVANSLRISDHAGYKHLDYKYNITTDRKKRKRRLGEKYLKEYYPPEDSDYVVKRILEEKRVKQYRYKDYSATVEKAKRNINNKLSFWQCCKKIE